MALEPKNPQEVIQLLKQIEQYSLKNAAPLPLEDDLKSKWSGIGFRMGHYNFVIAMEFVVEIMKFPPISQVPGSKEWVRGIANIRGNLLPIFDLQGFLDKTLTQIKRETRILSIAKNELNAGLIVDEIYGMKYFDQINFNPELDYDTKWKGYYNGGYALEGENWIVFNIQQLIENQDFLNVAN
ncbi:MAG: purine-binding chemotaxis protein CheW [Bacteroidales bacterium]|nr:purine-binding chemotaxis protein CheW [Bacteroidales bacterium]